MAGNTWGGSWGESPNCSWGDSWGFEGFVAPVTTPTIPPGGGNYLEWWERQLRKLLSERKKKKLPKKKREIVERLEEQVDELALIAAEQQATEAYTREMRQQVLEAAALVNQAYEAKVSNERLMAEIRAIKEYMDELDDEDIIFLALH